MRKLSEQEFQRESNPFTNITLPTTKMDVHFLNVDFSSDINCSIQKFINETMPNTIPSQTSFILLKIIGFITFVLLNLGNCLLFGIIHFEKYGQDFQKRSFPDQIFAFNCHLHIYVTLVNAIILEIRSYLGPLGHFPAFLVFFNREVYFCHCSSFYYAWLKKCHLSQFC